jgi:hypothetical protein
MNRLLGSWILIAFCLGRPAHPQVIEFESNGMKYQTLSKSGVTIMFTALATHLHEYAIIEVSVSNGSKGPYIIRPENFTYVRNDASPLQGSAARSVISEMIEKGSGSDVIKLVNAYEAALYGIPHFKSTNGYESRREAALSMNSRIRAAAAASAIALVETKLAPGESTDGAVFFPTESKPLGPGHLVVRTNTDEFNFNPE